MWCWLRFGPKYQFIPFLANLCSSNRDGSNLKLSERYPRNPQTQQYPDPKAIETMSETKDPISIPEGQVKDTTTDTTSREQQNLSVFTVPYPSLALITPIAVNLESVPRSAAGAVNDARDALDDVGNIVVKVTDIDP
ncbi:hypothetical protein QL093DRAFT_1134349 [Fusarium oxysporum]|nr:hypothetical protein QL093DRAFT_1134349 [Fusarium oxysporum]